MTSLLASTTAPQPNRELFANLRVDTSAETARGPTSSTWCAPSVEPTRPPVAKTALASIGGGAAPITLREAGTATRAPGYVSRVSDRPEDPSESRENRLIKERDSIMQALFRGGYFNRPPAQASRTVAASGERVVVVQDLAHPDAAATIAAAAPRLANDGEDSSLEYSPSSADGKIAGYAVRYGGGGRIGDVSKGHQSTAYADGNRAFLDSNATTSLKTRAHTSKLMKWKKVAGCAVLLFALILANYLVYLKKPESLQISIITSTAVYACIAIAVSCLHLCRKK